MRLAGDVGDEEREDRRPGDRPAGAPRVPTREHQPAERPGAAEGHEDRGGGERVAGDDRQARGGGDDEGGGGEDAGGGGEPGALGDQPQRERRAGGGADEDGLADDLADPAREVERDVDQPRL